jgi:predicted porin
VKAVFELLNQYAFANGSAILSAGALFNRTALVRLDSDRFGKLTLGTQLSRLATPDEAADAVIA